MLVDPQPRVAPAHRTLSVGGRTPGHSFDEQRCRELDGEQYIIEAVRPAAPSGMFRSPLRTKTAGGVTPLAVPDDREEQSRLRDGGSFELDHLAGDREAGDSEHRGGGGDARGSELAGEHAVVREQRVHVGGVDVEADQVH